MSLCGRGAPGHGDPRQASGPVRTYEEMNLVDRREVRRLLLCIDDTAAKVSKLPLLAKELTDLAKWRKDLTATAEYAPTWVIVSIAWRSVAVPWWAGVVSSTR